jgi:hypothetical protein
MLSDGTGVGVDIAMSPVTLTSVFCSDSGWTIGGEVAATSTENCFFRIFNCQHDYDTPIHDHFGSTLFYGD